MKVVKARNMARSRREWSIEIRRDLEEAMETGPVEKPWSRSVVRVVEVEVARGVAQRSGWRQVGRLSRSRTGDTGRHFQHDMSLVL